MRVLICDDSKLNLEMNRVMVKNYCLKRDIKPAIVMASNFYNEEDRKIKLSEIDIALLDIDFGGAMLGIEIARELKKYNAFAIVIFITNHEEFAMEAFHVSALGYLKKPVDETEFSDVFTKALIQLNGIHISRRYNEVIHVISEGKNRVIKQGEILSISRAGRSTTITTKKEDIHTYDSIKSISGRLTDSFIQLDRSTVVNVNYIYQIIDDVVEMSNQTVFTIPRRKVKEVWQQVSEGSRQSLIKIGY